ncbi:MAG TPA: hypothetical protein VG297_07115 [Bryobacteraceae bacterium]|nr:hypothetical protein [Bryobacteraceae bacterium]
MSGTAEFLKPAMGADELAVEAALIAVVKIERTGFVGEGADGEGGAGRAGLATVLEMLFADLVGDVVAFEHPKAHFATGHMIMVSTCSSSTAF